MRMIAQIIAEIIRVGKRDDARRFIEHLPDLHCSFSTGSIGIEAEIYFLTLGEFRCILRFEIIRAERSYGAELAIPGTKMLHGPGERGLVSREMQLL